MDRTIMRAGLMSGIAMAIFSTVPAQAQEGDGMMRHSMMHRAMRHEMHREMMHRMMHREMRHERHRRMMMRRMSDGMAD